MASAVDGFLASRVYPIMKEAGFRRHRREFILGGPKDMVGVVGFYPRSFPDSVGFSIQYGVVPPALIRWRESRNIVTPTWLSPSEALLMAQAFTPDLTQRSGDPWSQPYQWKLGDERWNEWLAVEVAAALQDEVLASVVAWFDPIELARAIRDSRPGRFPGMNPTPRALAMALLDTAPSADLAAELSLLPESDPVRIWVEQEIGEIPTSVALRPTQTYAVRPPSLAGSGGRWRGRRGAARSSSARRSARRRRAERRDRSGSRSR